MSVLFQMLGTKPYDDRIGLYASSTSETPAQYIPRLVTSNQRADINEGLVSTDYLSKYEERVSYIYPSAKTQVVSPASDIKIDLFEYIITFYGNTTAQKALDLYKNLPPKARNKIKASADKLLHDRKLLIGILESNSSDRLFQIILRHDPEDFGISSYETSKAYETLRKTETIIKMQQF